MVIDFAADISDGIIKLEETIKDIDVGILVNNAGLSQIIPTFFHETEEETWETLVKVNLVAPTVVTSTVLPYILKRRSGAIINVGSGSTVVIPSFPLYAVYTGTKGYDLVNFIFVTSSICNFEITERLFFSFDSA